MRATQLEKDQDQQCVQEQEGGEEDPKNYEVVRADDPNMVNTTRYYAYSNLAKMISFGFGLFEF